MTEGPVPDKNCINEIDNLKKELETLYKVEGFLSSISDISKLLNVIMDESKDVAKAEASSCLLYDKINNDLYFEVATGEKGDEIKKIRLPVDDTSIAGSVARTRVTENINDVHKDPRWFQKADEKSSFQTRSILAVPMTRKDNLLGVLEVLNKVGGGGFTEEDVRILEALAGQAAIAIENAQLFEANLQAERLAAVGMAVSGVAHCIKNIITGLKGGAMLVDMGIEKENDEILGKGWDIVKRNNARISDLVMDMLTYSKEREPEYSLYSLNSVAREVYDLMQEKAALKNVSIKLIDDQSMPECFFDPKEIHRCVLNIVGNAVDALEEKDGGSVTIRTYLKKVDPEDPGRDLIVLEAEDNGVGIPADKLKTIFMAFYSSKGSRGTGLGLPVTEKIIKEHGGAIIVDSVLGEGTKFTIELPARQKPPAGNED